MDWMNVAEMLERQAKDLSALDIGLRAALVYVVILVIIRLAKKRFMGRATPMDVIVGIMAGSVASRAITGNAPMIGSMVGVAVILALHWLLSAVSLRWHGFGAMAKGYSRLLIRQGKVDGHMLRKVHMTDRDLAEALREKGVNDPEQVAEARLERSGEVSVIRKEG